MNKRLMVSVAASTVLTACGGGDNINPTLVSQLFAQTNDSANTVVHFVRNSVGTLTTKGNVQTGGKGTNGVNYVMCNIVAPDALTSNNSVIVSTGKTRLFVANAGDNTVSTFSISNAGDITLLAVSAAGGTRPTSLA